MIATASETTHSDPAGAREGQRTARNPRPLAADQANSRGFLAALHPSTSPVRNDRSMEETMTDSKISVRDFDFYYGPAKVLHGI
jgi:hypothetical protein